MKPIWPLLLSLCACSNLSPLAMMQLMSLSPMKTDPALLAVALEVPQGVSLPEGSAFLSISAVQTVTGETSNHKYTLHAQPVGSGKSVFKIAQQDLPKIRQQQALIAGWERADPDATQGSMSVGLTGCRTVTGPQPEGVVNIALQTSPDGAFIPLVTNMPWADVLEQTELSELPYC